MKKYVEKLIKDPVRGVKDNIFKGVLSFASFFYGIGIFLWDVLYNKKIAKIHDLGLSVISIGNITAGGTGKTPISIFIAKALQEKGKKVGVLIRGYGEDEHKMLKEKLGNIPVIVGRDRVLSAKTAKKEHGCDTIVLDDGFQHRRVKRDKDILVIDASSPFSNGKLLPAGFLREPKQNVKRADIAIINKTDLAPENIAGIEAYLLTMDIINIFRSSYSITILLDVKTGRSLDVCEIAGQKVFVLCGIANPEYFKYMIEKHNVVCAAGMFFPDHHAYEFLDIKKVIEQAKKAGCRYVLTTDKDEVKLRSIIQSIDTDIIFVNVKINVEIENAEALIDKLT